MIQFNLLPDVKLEYIKATYRRRIISMICFIVAGAFLFVFILMFIFVRFNQKTQLQNLDKDIDASVKTLRETKDLDKILTIQNQLHSLPDAHSEKVMTSRLFDYVGQLKPAEIGITNMELDVEGKKIFIKGDSDSIATINKFIDTLKYTDYEYTPSEGDPQKGKAFSTVVMDDFAINGSTSQNGNDGGRAINFGISFNYEPTIFMNTAKDSQPLFNAVKLTVPSIISTPSETQKPSLSASPSTGGGN